MFCYPGFPNYDVVKKLVIASRTILVRHSLCACAVPCNENPALTVAFVVHGITLGHRIVRTKTVADGSVAG